MANSYEIINNSNKRMIHVQLQRIMFQIFEISLQEGAKNKKLAKQYFGQIYL